MSYIDNIMRNTAYSLDIFSKAEIEAFETTIETAKDKKGEEMYYATCLIRQKSIKLTPEEVVRQLYLGKLLNEYHYPKDRIILEYQVQFGSDNSKRADIVILDKKKDVAYIIIELKKPKQSEGKEQLKSYCYGTGAPMGVWTNGQTIEYYHRQYKPDGKETNIFEPIDNIPTFHQTLKDVFDERCTIIELTARDRLKFKSLKRIIQEFEDEVLANAGVDVFEEAFKLIFSKLYDEHQSGKDKDKLSNFFENNPDITSKELYEYLAKLKSKQPAGLPTDNQKVIQRFFENVYKNFRELQFRNVGVESETKTQIDKLFEDAKTKWKGIFQPDDKIKLSDSHLQTCVSYLQDIKLFNSNLEVVDEAFEYLINKDAKGDKGQYFTPRYVIDMCVKMLNPQAHEYMIDTASGSCGFPVHTIFHVWQQLNPTANHLFTSGEKTQEQIDYVREKVFAIDFDEKAVRVGRTLNLIAGDGETNVLHMNSLDYERWEADYYERKEWKKQYGNGFENLENLKAHRKNGFKNFKFNIVMANPPFAGDIKDKRLIQKYFLAKKFSEEKDKKTGAKLTKEKGWHEKISRDILFIERNLDMLAEGGRMAIVLPQGRFNNSSDAYIRKYIGEHCRILAVVGLHGNTFKPHTGTKTSVLFVQKWTGKDGINPKQDDYNIFFATQQLSGKDNSGDKLYWQSDRVGTTTRTEEAENDLQGHPVVYHDLFSTITETGKTPDGITEAFIEFAKREKLPFWLGK